MERIADLDLDIVSCHSSDHATSASGLSCLRIVNIGHSNRLAIIQRQSPVTKTL